VKKAFSLIELMIVIVILGLLASMVMPNLVGKADDAKRKLVCIQMNSVFEALKMYKLDNGVYPSMEEGLAALSSNPDPELYVNYSSHAYIEGKKIPKDSWGSPFIYINKEGVVDLISFGADRKEEGKGEGADIRFSQCP
jgi:general secretion pathway protein G